MEVSSLEISKKLWELSGWEYDQVQGYSAGMMLRKLPKGKVGKQLTLFKCDGFNSAEDSYMAYFDILVDKVIADTPENALALLACELFENGILTKEQSNE